MIRCRASPLFLCALALWCTLFLAPLFSPVLLLAGPAALAVCAVSLSVLGLTAPRLRRAGVWLLAAGVGLALGVLRLWSPVGEGTGGLPLEQVRGFGGVLAEDSTPTSGGVMSYRVALRSVRSGQFRRVRAGRFGSRCGAGPAWPGGGW